MEFIKPYRIRFFFFLSFFLYKHLRLKQIEEKSHYK